MIEQENLILSDGQNSNQGPLIGKASQDEMFADTRNKMHNYANEIIDNYQSNDTESSSKKNSGGFLLKLLFFAIVVAALIIVYNIYK
jgi:hypothetical protein